MPGPPPITSGPAVGYINAQACGHRQWFSVQAEWGWAWCDHCGTKVPTLCVAVDRQGRLVASA